MHLLVVGSGDARRLGEDRRIEVGAISLTRVRNYAEPRKRLVAGAGV